MVYILYSIKFALIVFVWHLLQAIERAAAAVVVRRASTNFPLFPEGRSLCFILQWHGIATTIKQLLGHITTLCVCECMSLFIVKMFSATTDRMKRCYRETCSARLIESSLHDVTLKMYYRAHYTSLIDIGRRCNFLKFYDDVSGKLAKRKYFFSVIPVSR